MVYRATANLHGAVTACKGDDLSGLPAKTLEGLKGRGLVKDDGKAAVKTDTEDAKPAAKASRSKE